MANRFAYRGPSSRELVLLQLLVAANLSDAAMLNVVNPGFEDISGETVVNEFTFGPLNGWDLYDPNQPQITDGGDGPNFYIGTLTPQPDPGNPGDFINFPAGAPEGNRVAIAFNFAATGGTGEYGLMQEITTAQLQPFTEYTLQVDVGDIASGMAVSGTFFTLDGFPGYRIDLMAGDEILVQDLNSLQPSLSDGEFLTSTISYTSGASHIAMNQNLVIRLVNLNEIDSDFPASDLEVDFDNVRLFAVPVPLPSVFPAMVVAVFAGWRAGRRQLV